MVSLDMRPESSIRAGRKAGNCRSACFAHDESAFVGWEVMPVVLKDRDGQNREHAIGAVSGHHIHLTF